MPVFKTVPIDAKVKVAVVFEPERPRPVWFEIAGEERVRISEVTAGWYHSSGAARVMNFEVWDGRERYSLAYDTLQLTWSVGRTVIE